MSFAERVLFRCMYLAVAPEPEMHRTERQPSASLQLPHGVCIYRHRLDGFRSVTACRQLYIAGEAVREPDTDREGPLMYKLKATDH